jgi:hypothetical protein
MKPSSLFAIEKLIIVVHESNNKNQCLLFPNPQCADHQGYAILAADLVRHIAKAFHVAEDVVWKTSR